MVTDLAPSDRVVWLASFRLAKAGDGMVLKGGRAGGGSAEKKCLTSKIRCVLFVNNSERTVHYV